jgi:hypothetical protein
VEQATPPLLLEPQLPVAAAREEAATRLAVWVLMVVEMVVKIVQQLRQPLARTELAVAGVVDMQVLVLLVVMASLL